MSDTTRTAGAIDVPYDPESCIGDFGWIWLATSMGEEWVLCRTIEDEDGLVTEAWTSEATFDTHDCHAAEDLRGQPYLPIAAPACVPGSGFEAQVHLPGGGVMRYGLDGSEDAAATRERVLAALRIGARST